MAERSPQLEADECHGVHPKYRFHGGGRRVHGWDFAYDNRSNVIDVLILRLRRKIDEPFGQQSLETVRGADYRLRRGTGKAT